MIEKFPPKVLPEWMKVLAPDSCLRAADIMSLWNVCPTTLHKMIREGKVPPPDDVLRKGRRSVGVWGNTPNQWRADTVRKFIRRWWKEHGEAQ